MTQKNKIESRRNESQRIREQLRYWPFTIHQVDETLDLSMIEGRGRQILFQALNAQNITAFVGSGMSASYGRLSWPAWKQEQLALVEQNYNAFTAVAEAAVELFNYLQEAVKPKQERAGKYRPQVAGLRKELFEEHDAKELQPLRHNCWQWFKFRSREIQNALDQIQHLHATFNRVKDTGDGFPGGDGFPVVFEIAQQLQDELRRNVPLFLDESKLGQDLQPDPDMVWPGSFIGQNGAAPAESLRKLKQRVQKEIKRELTTLFKEPKLNPAPDPESLLEAFCTYIQRLQSYYAAYSRPEASFTFETLAKILLVDECAHAMLTLRKGFGADLSADDLIKEKGLAKLERGLKVFDDGTLRRDVEGIRDKPERYAVLSPFRLSHFTGLDEKGDPVTSVLDLDQLIDEHETFKGLLTYLKSGLTDYANTSKQSGDVRRFLTPSSRFFLAMCLALHSKEKRKELITNDHGTRGTLFSTEMTKKDFTSRRSIIADRFDPLNKVVDDLGVRRFITLNYDFEIERYFVDAGFRNFPPKTFMETEASKPVAEDYRVDGIGRVLFDQAFEREKASDMVRFSMGQGNESAAVFHLHGRATEGERLVITERDYMNLYLLEDQHRETVHEGITMAFSSAPLLFLGLGMSETDLLRPLRQFMSNEDRTSGYSSVALLPAEHMFEDRTKYAAALYLRYGVHTIFYGGGEIKLDGQGDPISIDWLATIMAIVSTLQSAVSDLQSTKPDADEQLKIAMKLIERCGSLGSDKAEATGDSALFLLLGDRVPQPKDKDGLEKSAKKLINLVVSTGAGEGSKLLDCTFTPVRRREENVQSPHYDDQAHIEGNVYTNFYTDLLTEVLRIALGPFADEVGKTWGVDTPARLPQDSPAARQLAALSIALDGLRGAFLTATMNAALEGLGLQWRSWWKKWQDAPPRRIAKFDERTNKAEDMPQRYVRHPVDNVISQFTKDPPKDAPLLEMIAGGPIKLNAKWKTRIRAFDTFILSVATSPRPSPHGLEGRVMYTVAAHRGLGKGSFQTALASERGLAAYREAAWPRRGTQLRRANFVSSAFINLSFATEIASCYDMLARVIHDFLVANDDRLGDSDADRNKKLRKKLTKLSRIGTLKHLLDTFAAYSKREARLNSQPRLLIVLSSIDLLYHRLLPKNGEIQGVLNVLAGEETKDHPFDLIVIGSEEGLGWPIGGKADKRPIRNIRVDRPDIPPMADEQIAERIKNGSVKIDPPGVGDDKPINHVHFARQVSPVMLLVDNFPLLATGLALKSHLEDDPSVKDILNTPVDKDYLEDNTKRFDDTVRKQREASDKTMEKAFQSDALPSTGQVDEARRDVGRKTLAALEHVLLKAARPDTLIDPVPSDDKAQINALLRRIVTHRFTHHSNWSDIRRYLRYNRFSVTIILAAAENMIAHAASPLNGVRRAEQFILSTANRVRSVGDERREQMVLESVLATYREFHKIGDPDLDIELQQIILRHLGVIGAPLSSAVIVRLPQVRAYFDRVGVEPETSRRRFISRTLTVLAHRGLIFRIEPHPRLKHLQEETERKLAILFDLNEDTAFKRKSRTEQISMLVKKSHAFEDDPEFKTNLKERVELVAKEHRDLTFSTEELPKIEDPYWPADEEHRYALHRIVQRFAVSVLGTTIRDPVANNIFAPTVYSSMPSTGAQLNNDSFGFIRHLMISLSQYPDLAHGDKQLRPWLHASSVRKTSVQALRAGLSLARSTLSVSTISRFGGFSTGDKEFPKRGYLETYKVRLRWLVRLAWELAHPQPNPDDNQVAYQLNPNSFGYESNRVQALYRDEIVWLYNELGVIALAQGSLTEALAFLRQAAEYNEPIEGRSRSGPIFDHIDLNHAIVQMERGRLTSAQRRLNRIIKVRESEGCVIHASARGYMCVLDHLTGQIDELGQRFKKVTTALQELDDARASAIMLTHRARFLHGRDPNEAKRCIKAAEAKAETGGHEDIRQQIAIVRLAFAHRDYEGRPGDLQRLKEIEAYGRRMDIWSIQVDALKLRAEILLDKGETGSAGADAIRALSIAKRFRMNLRASSALTLYAKVLLERGNAKGAYAQARQALEMAKAIGYNIETSRAQQIVSTCKSAAGQP